MRERKQLCTRQQREGVGLSSSEYRAEGKRERKQCEGGREFRFFLCFVLFALLGRAIRCGGQSPEKEREREKIHKKQLTNPTEADHEREREATINQHTTEHIEPYTGGQVQTKYST